MIKTLRFLEEEYQKRDTLDELTLKKPDPLMIAKQYNDEYISLICALFAYGNANSIVNFLSSLDFSLLDQSDKKIEEKLSNHYYRFQNSQDIIEIFKTLKRMKKKNESLEDIFCLGYKKKYSVIDGLKSLISYMYEINSYESRGYKFLLGKVPGYKVTSPYKRWNMYLRWMVRDDTLDLGLWRQVDRKNLLLPLDTHTFFVGKKLGLIKRKSYDFQAVLEITNNLKILDRTDPIKYDFALYRIGQEKRLL